MRSNQVIYKLIMIVFALFMILSQSVDMAVAQKKSLGGENNGCLGLNYHRIREDTWIDKILTIFSNSKELKIYSITDDEFESQVKWLKEHNAKFITLEELIRYKENKNFPKNCVWINFDDMDQSIYDNAFKVLKKYDIPGTGFVITNEVGSSNFHNIKLISKTDLLEMRNSGLWSFASHTADMHTMNNNTSRLVLAKDNRIKQDINRSTNYIKNEVDGNIQAFAYPYGQTSDKVVNQLKTNTSIKYAFTLEDRAITPGDDNYYIPRIMVSEDSFNNLIKKWEGFNYE